MATFVTFNLEQNKIKISLEFAKMAFFFPSNLGQNLARNCWKSHEIIKKGLNLQEMLFSYT